MLRNVCSQVFMVSKGVVRTPNSRNTLLLVNQAHRFMSNDQGKQKVRNSHDDLGTEEKKELVIAKPRMLFEKEFPDYYSDGKFIARISYVDFIDQALEKLDELGLAKDINAYKELLRIFPPGKYHPKKYDIGMFHAPQQLCALRLLFKMEMNGLRPDRDFQILATQAFSIYSDVWKKVVKMNYWSSKGRNVDPNPLPEKLPQEPYKLAKLAIQRMVSDQRTTVITANTARLPAVVDKTWVVYCQNDAQRKILQNLDVKSTLYVEDCGYVYTGDKYLSYYALRYRLDDETVRKKQERPKPDYNFNTLEFRFFGKPIREKLIEEEERHFIDNGYILALGITGTSSHDSLLSWLKLMQEKVPRLAQLNVMFNIKRQTHDLIEFSQETKREETANN